MASGPMIIAHRGASGYRPEHTASAYQLAVVLGADALEPDIVATRDGELVLRHENEISGTTDVAAHPEFAARRTTRLVDGAAVTGWFTEDFTWEELSTLRTRERLPKTRTANASFDGRYPLLRLSDLFAIIDRASDETGRAIGMVAELKHASHFAAAGLPLDELFAAEVARAGWAADDERLTVEAFELGVLESLPGRGLGAKRIFLLEDDGAPFDEVLLRGQDAATYADFLTEPGLRDLATRVDGISVPKSLIIGSGVEDEPGTTDLVERAHGHGLEVFTWTLRPENRFLTPAFRRGRRAGYGDWLGEFSLVLGSGVDGVFADHPDLALDARSALLP